MYFIIRKIEGPIKKVLEIGPKRNNVPCHSSDWIPGKVLKAFEDMNLYEFMEGMYDIEEFSETDLRKKLFKLGFKEIKVIHTFKVISNFCRCHPETCCCDDYKIVDENGDCFASGMDKEKLQELVDQANGEK